MAFSKTATLILALHTFIIFLNAHTIQYRNIHDEKILSYPPILLTLFQGFSYVIMSFGAFVFTMFVNYCCVSRKSRVGFRRHVLSGIVFAPILAWVGGREFSVL
ncbi:hypothetical protein B0J14DRAFT_607644 [Halenospora varia]|nr:hypothetical protein B0J14DRAFT_607644 [Halenospora varia]